MEKSIGVEDISCVLFLEYASCSHGGRGPILVLGP
jgi:hypothetical protein